MAKSQDVAVGGGQTPTATSPAASPKPPSSPKPSVGEEIDIDLNDPEVEKAAMKIQASFKGFQVRKDIAAEKGKKVTQWQTSLSLGDAIANVTVAFWLKFTVTNKCWKQLLQSTGNLL